VSRPVKALFSGLSLLWLASSIDGSGIAYAVFLAGSFAAGIVMGAYGSPAPGVAAVIASVILSVVVKGSVEAAPLLAAVTAILVSSVRVPRGVEALSLAPPLAAALILFYASLSAPDALAAAAPRLPGDTGLFLAALLSSKTGVILSSITSFLVAAYLAGSAARALAELALARVAPREALEAERRGALEELRGSAVPGHVYWLMGLLIASLLAPYLAAMGAPGLLLGAAATLYFRLLLSAIVEWRVRRVALLTWPLAGVVALLSGLPAGLVADALGVPGPAYSDPLAWLADPLAEAYVESSLRRALELAAVAVRLFWGG